MTGKKHLLAIQPGRQIDRKLHADLRVLAEQGMLSSQPAVIDMRLAQKNGIMVSGGNIAVAFYSQDMRDSFAPFYEGEIETTYNTDCGMSGEIRSQYPMNPAEAF